MSDLPVTTPAGSDVDRPSTRLVWAAALLPVFPLVAFLVEPTVAVVYLAAGAVWLVTLVLAFVDERRVRAAGVPLKEQTWVLSLFLPLAYLVQRTRKAKSTILVPALWLVTATAFVVTVAVIGTVQRFTSEEVEEKVQTYLQRLGTGGGIDIECPAIEGREGDVFRCALVQGPDSLPVDVVLKARGEIAVKVRVAK